MADTDLKIDGLQKFSKALKEKPPQVRVGILGNFNARSEPGSGPNNATIGAAHEYGTSRLATRSFLRVPLTTYLEKELEGSGAFTEDAMKRVIAQKSLLPWVEKMGIVAVGIVLDAFNTGGSGTWAPLSAETMARKKVKQILVETQQLRNSVTYEVKP